ncbi:hypothetical protein NCLIV_006200 [Neospora caninum Liverpool]|uniref:Transmembrane protein n=1 Tax=Neospora caninum (strain Liverpool) TaxID=572307 RepID=F0V8V3_NEOCL|nr:hypothetical protein NCLIV_006200 [Neospora caninum Liverpool]CBZ50144.1 hypothetical protein NCLIV_006200 [Neospora caninum Liverpool]CEL64739.1 TPA: hypothetical protein BN1204_006200 [Neospora caninum Liverpool]|eukprot:XP_003880179.1 hypothetical protein NCLIV_006200 [Neospora caninum Liverpool]
MRRPSRASGVFPYILLVCLLHSGSSSLFAAFAGEAPPVLAPFAQDEEPPTAPEAQIKTGVDSEQEPLQLADNIVSLREELEERQEDEADKPSSRTLEESGSNGLGHLPEHLSSQEGSVEHPVGNEEVLAGRKDAEDVSTSRTATELSFFMERDSDDLYTSFDSVPGGPYLAAGTELTRSLPALDGQLESPAGPMEAGQYGTHSTPPVPDSTAEEQKQRDNLGTKEHPYEATWPPRQHPKGNTWGQTAVDALEQGEPAGAARLAVQGSNSDAHSLGIQEGTGNAAALENEAGPDGQAIVDEAGDANQASPAARRRSRKAGARARKRSGAALDMLIPLVTAVLCILLYKAIAPTAKRIGRERRRAQAEKGVSSGV